MPNDKDFELDDLESFSFDDLPLEEAEATNDSASGEDPFGVWVKSAPDEVETGSGDDLPLGTVLPDFDDSLDVDDSLPEEDFLSSDELASLDDSFEFVTVDEPTSETIEPLEDEIAFLDAPESRQAEAADESSFDEISLDDFVSFDSADDSFAPVASSPMATTDEVVGEEDPEEEFLDIDIDIEDDIGDEELEIIEGALPKASDDLELVEASFDSEEIDLSEFGEFDDTSEVLPESSAPTSAAVPLTTEDSSLPDLADFETGLDLGAEFEDSIPLAPVTEHDSLPDFESLPALDLDVGDSDDNGEFEEILLDEGDRIVLEPNPAELEPQDETDLEHLKALEEDLTSGIRTSPEPSGAPAQDVAAIILSKIEQELSSIKQEIFALKHEVTSLRTAPVSSIQETSAVTLSPVEQAPEEPSKGFFDEEDDETIALTGDELDNILSTAEISEENEAGESLDDDLLATDAEGNLVTDSFSDDEISDPLDQASPEGEWQNGPVNDEEFLSGTSLELDDTPSAGTLEDDLEDEFASLGIPESIELEDDLPVSVDSEETENLLESSEHSFMAEGANGESEALEIPVDDELAEELSHRLSMDPEPVEDAPVPESSELSNEDELVVDLVKDETSEEEFSPERDGDPEGWSPSSAEAEPQKSVEPAITGEGKGSELPKNLKDELRAVLAYMDKLLSSLPDDKIQEFAESEHFEVYKKLFEELGLID